MNSNSICMSTSNKISQWDHFFFFFKKVNGKRVEIKSKTLEKHISKLFCMGKIENRILKSLKNKIL